MGDRTRERVPRWHWRYWFGYRWRLREDWYDGPDYSSYETEQQRAAHVLQDLYNGGR